MSTKLCVLCNIDCSQQPRFQDPAGNYYCQPCYEASRRIPPPGSTPLDVAAPHMSWSLPERPEPRQLQLAGARQNKSSKRSDFFQTPQGIALAAGGALALLWVLAWFSPILLSAYVLIVILFTLGTGVMILAAAFRTSTVQGLLSLFVPFYQLYFIYVVNENGRLKVLLPLTLAAMISIFLIPSSSTSVTQTPSSGSSVLAVEAPPDAYTANIGGHPVSISPNTGFAHRGRFRGGRRMVHTVNGQRHTIVSPFPMSGETLDVGDTKLMIINDELIVNYKTYGGLRSGDEVLVDHGNVSINGKPAAEKNGDIRITDG